MKTSNCLLWSCIVLGVLGGLGPRDCVGDDDSELARYLRTVYERNRGTAVVETLSEKSVGEQWAWERSGVIRIGNEAPIPFSLPVLRHLVNSDRYVYEWYAAPDELRHGVIYFREESEPVGEVAELRYGAGIAERLARAHSGWMSGAAIPEPMSEGLRDRLRAEGGSNYQPRYGRWSRSDVAPVLGILRNIVDGGYESDESETQSRLDAIERNIDERVRELGQRLEELNSHLAEQGVLTKRRYEGIRARVGSNEPSVDSQRKVHAARHRAGRERLGRRLEAAAARPKTVRESRVQLERALGATQSQLAPGTIDPEMPTRMFRDDIDAKYAGLDKPQRALRRGVLKHGVDFATARTRVEKVTASGSEDRTFARTRDLTMVETFAALKLGLAARVDVGSAAGGGSLRQALLDDADSARFFARGESDNVWDSVGLDRSGRLAPREVPDHRVGGPGDVTDRVVSLLDSHPATGRTLAMVVRRDWKLLGSGDPKVVEKAIGEVLAESTKRIAGPGLSEAAALELSTMGSELRGSRLGTRLRTEMSRYRQELRMTVAATALAADDKYKPVGGVTKCNLFVSAFADDVFEYTQFAGINANGIAKQIREKDKGWNLVHDWSAKSGLDVAAGLVRSQELANKGYLVVIAWENPSGHGHVAVVVPGELRESTGWGGKRSVPEIAQAGAVVFAKDRLSRGFGLAKRKRLVISYRVP